MEKQKIILRRPKNHLLVSAIRGRRVLKFVYNDRSRIVEPQTYGVSTTGKEVLRAHQIGEGKSVQGVRMAKLFEVARMKDLVITKHTFRAALNFHNPKDNAMIEIFATLPKPLKV